MQLGRPLGRLVRRQQPLRMQWPSWPLSGCQSLRWPQSAQSLQGWRQTGNEGCKCGSTVLCWTLCQHFQCCKHTPVLLLHEHLVLLRVLSQLAAGNSLWEGGLLVVSCFVSCLMRACWEFPAGEETQQQSQLKRLLCDTLLLARDQPSRSLAHAQPSIAIDQRFDHHWSGCAWSRGRLRRR